MIVGRVCMLARVFLYLRRMDHFVKFLRFFKGRVPQRVITLHAGRTDRPGTTPKNTL